MVKRLILKDFKSFLFYFQLLYEFMILNSDDYKTKQTTETEKTKSFNYYDEMEIIDINYYITSI